MISPQRNHLLATLSPMVQKRLFPYLKMEFLPLGKVLYEPGHTLHQVYFPIDSIVSLLGVTESGSSTEVSMVGKEGLVGITVLMSGGSSTCRALVNSTGHAYSLSALRLRTEFKNSNELQMLLLHNVQVVIADMAQTAVCNRHHTIEQQLCRWMLMILDRLHGNHLSKTQELIANLLGVRRKSVTEAAGKLQKLGVIEYRRGHITVLDRHKLEKLSCECYSVVKTETNRLEACR